MHDVFALPEGRDHDDRQIDCRVSFPESFQDLQAIQPWHHDIQEHQVERMVPDQFQCQFAVIGHGDVAALALQTPREHIAVHFVVVDD